MSVLLNLKNNFSTISDEYGDLIGRLLLVSSLQRNGPLKLFFIRKEWSITIQEMLPTGENGREQ